LAESAFVTPLRALNAKISASHAAYQVILRAFLSAAVFLPSAAAVVYLPFAAAVAVLAASHAVYLAPAPL